MARRQRTVTEEDVDREIEFRVRRQGVIGGSDAQRILTGDALEVYHEKTRPIDRDDVREELEGRSIHLIRGRELEEKALRWWKRQTGRRAQHETKQVSHPEHPYLAVHPDGTIFADDDRESPKDDTGVLEIKSPGREVFHAIRESGLDTAKVVQLNYNMAVMRRRWGSWGVFNLEHEAGPIESVDVVRDDELARMLIERMDEFWRAHVDPRVPPDPDEWELGEKDRTAIELKDARGQEYVRDVEDERLMGLVEDFVEFRDLMNTAEKRYEDARQTLQAYVEDEYDTDAIALADGTKVRIIRQAAGSHLQPTTLLESRPIDRDAFVRFCREHDVYVDGLGALMADGVEELATALELDPDDFKREGSPSAYPQVYGYDGD